MLNSLQMILERDTFYPTWAQYVPKKKSKIPNIHILHARRPGNTKNQDYEIK